MSDGLTQLAQRGRRTRDIPPPRNPARAEPVPLASVPEQTPEPQGATPTPKPGPAHQAKPETVLSDSQPESKISSQPAPAATPVQPTTAKAALKVVTIYLEQDDDDFLETITHTGRTNQPRVAVSRSAVVRLALERLHGQLSPEQVVDELRPRGDQPGTGTGRKRR